MYSNVYHRRHDIQLHDTMLVVPTCGKLCIFWKPKMNASFVHIEIHVGVKLLKQCKQFCVQVLSMHLS